MIKLTYHFILSYIYNTFIVRHNKRRTYFQKLTYKTDLCDWNNWNFDVFKKEMQKEHTYTVDGLINGGGLISGWSYIRNYVFIGNWMGLYPGGLKTGGGFKVGFCLHWLDSLVRQKIQARNLSEETTSHCHYYTISKRFLFLHRRFFCHFLSFRRFLTHFVLPSTDLLDFGGHTPNP